MDLPDEFKIPEEAQERLIDREMLRKFIKEGKSLQEIIGYSDQLMEGLYQAALGIFKEGRFTQANDGFLFLTTINPYVYAYWLGLGMTYQKLEEYEQALLAYECCLALEQDAPLPNYHTASCHYLLGDTEKALDVLQATINKCKESPDHTHLLKQAEETVEKIKKTKK